VRLGKAGHLIHFRSPLDDYVLPTQQMLVANAPIGCRPHDALSRSRCLLIARGDYPCCQSVDTRGGTRLTLGPLCIVWLGWDMGK
jgi:hypothetical protein